MTSETHSHGWEKDTTREAHLQKKMILWTSGRIAIRACRPIALISVCPFEIEFLRSAPEFHFYLFTLVFFKILR